MDPSHQNTINQAISLLQGLVGKGASSGPAKINIPEFDNALAAFSDKGKSLSPEIQKLTSIFCEAAGQMKKIMGYSTICKKFAGDNEQKLKNKFISLSKDTEEVERKGMDYIDHARAIREQLSVTFWVFVPTPEIIIKGAIESADFHALKFQRKKNQDHNDWYKHLCIAVRGLEKYVVENYPSGLNFNFNGTGKWEDLLSGATTAPSAESKTVPLANQPKQQTEVKKQKKKELIGQNFNISNFQNEKIEFTEGELQMKHGIFIQNCKNISIKIDAKFKSIQINKSEGVTLVIQNCVSGVQIMNSKQINLLVHQRTPSVSVDHSQVVRIVLNENNLETDIVSSKASELTVSYEKQDGNEAKDFMVCEQLITKWCPTTKKFETKIYDKFL